MDWIVWIVIWLLCGFGASAIAKSKGRDGTGWFWLGVLFGPLAILIIGFMAPREKKEMVQPDIEKYVYSDDRVIVTSDSVIIDDWTYPINRIQLVDVEDAGVGKWKIVIKNLSGKEVFTIFSDNVDVLKQVEIQINAGIYSAEPVTDDENLASPTPATESALYKLGELKKMVEGGLISEEDYTKKKDDILSRM